MKKQKGYSKLAPYYDLMIDWDTRLQNEIPFIKNVCPPGTNFQKRLLDIGCGTGFHLKALRESGYQVEGTEPTKELRQIARNNLKDIKIHSTPMEELAELTLSHGPWQLITCLGNTLAHLPPDKLDIFCQGLVNALDTGGTGIIHLINYEKIINEMPEKLPTKKKISGADSYRFERLYHYRKNYIEFCIKVWKNGSLLLSDYTVIYPITQNMLTEILQKTSQRIDIKAFGKFDTAVPYCPESDNLVLTIIKS